MSQQSGVSMLSRRKSSAARRSLSADDSLPSLRSPLGPERGATLTVPSTSTRRRSNGELPSMTLDVLPSINSLSTHSLLSVPVLSSRRRSFSDITPVVSKNNLVHQTRGTDRDRLHSNATGSFVPQANAMGNVLSLNSVNVNVNVSNLEINTKVPFSGKLQSVMHPEKIAHDVTPSELANTNHSDETSLSDRIQSLSGNTGASVPSAAADASTFCESLSFTVPSTHHMRRRRSKSSKTFEVWLIE
jgi:hypothetical protein